MDALVAAKGAGADGRTGRRIVPIADPIATDLGSRAWFALTLPEGCKSEPRIEWQPLVDAGTVSDPAFELELGVAHYWDETKRSRGHGSGRVYRTVPEVRRNRSGVMRGRYQQAARRCQRPSGALRIRLAGRYRRLQVEP